MTCNIESMKKHLLKFRLFLAGKKKRTIVLIFILFATLIILLPNILVKSRSKDRVFDSTENLPKNKVGLLLGTAKYLQSGINPYYQYRIEAAIQLFNSRKLDFILISGDNSRKTYDEPSTMKSDLVKAGIPESRIYLDYAGFRTYDSVIRSKKIFGLDSLTIISQRFHNERAIYICQKLGIEAIGYNARDVSLKTGLKTRLREILARDKMMLDLMTNKKPKFLGDKIEIK
jgi:SanA protein